MITQDKVWNTIDKIAKNKGLSLMRLAELSHLDKTCLFPTKRTLPYGIIHYPSLRTIEKILKATGITFVEFAKMVEENAES